MKDVIVVGASAGGIRALKGVLAGLPRELPASVLAVVHIPRHGTSVLPLILDAAGPLPAKAAEDGEALARGTVYVAPPDRHLLVEGGRLRLTRGPRENRVRPCVDALFRSAAVDLGPRVVGVVLSGTLDDGTAGLWAIKDRGGVAVVQQPDEAEYPDMPASALANVEVDHVLRVAEMGPKLAALALEKSEAQAPVPDAMAAEAEIELGGHALQKGVLELGVPSPNSCPECRGSLVEIREGPIVRYRCHTGHAYSLQTLLAETDADIEKALWNAVRAIEERSFLRKAMERRAREAGDVALADRLAADAARDVADAQRVRRLTAGPAAA
ncbi:MAG TPA: chemotaxis protein CheB [Gammaproteobacteria bacterium]|nr:chemotaxis protein CheB [Gammaproteobacteria bacterium]